MEKRQAVEFLEYLRQDRNLERTIYGDALNMAIEALKAQLSHESTTSDTISRRAAIDAVNNAFDRETLLTGFVRSIAVRAIRDMPSAQPEPQEGEWEQVSAQRYFMSASYFYRCSACGVNNVRNTNYCPNCGAKMKGERQK